MNISNINKSSIGYEPSSTGTSPETISASNPKKEVLKATASKVKPAIQTNLAEVIKSNDEIGTDSKLNNVISKDSHSLSNPATSHVVEQALYPNNSENEQEEQAITAKTEFEIPTEQEERESGSDLESTEADKYMEEDKDTSNSLTNVKDNINAEHSRQLAIHVDDPLQQDTVEPENPRVPIQEAANPIVAEEEEPPAAPEDTNNTENIEIQVQEVAVQPAPAAHRARRARDPNAAIAARQAGLARQAAIQAQRGAAAPNNNDPLDDPLDGLANLVAPRITTSDIQRITNRVGNDDGTRVTQEVLKDTIDDLKSLSPNSQIKIKSKLATNPDGSYKLETHRMKGANEDFYKINCSYTISLMDAQGQPITTSAGAPVKVTVERYIYIKSPTKPQEALLAASRYKQTMVQLAEDNANQRLTGDYNDANKSALLKQRDFTFSSTNNNIQADIPATATTQAHKLNLNLAAKQLGPNDRYIRNFKDADSYKAKRTQINQDEKFVSSQRIYRSKEESLRSAPYKIINPNDYQNLITSSKFDFRLYELKTEVEKKEKELEALKATFKEGYILGLGSKNTSEYEKYLKETSSQYQKDHFTRTRPTETTDYLKLEKERPDVDEWTRNISDSETGVEQLQNLQDETIEFDDLDLDYQNLLNNKNLTTKQELVGLKSLKPEWTIRIDSLIPLDAATLSQQIQEPRNADILQELNDKRQNIKIMFVIEDLKEKVEKNKSNIKTFQKEEATLLDKRNMFNENLILLENAQRELKEIGDRLENLRNAAAAEPNQAEPNHNKITSEFSEKRIKEIKKKAGDYKKLIDDLHTDLVKAGIREIRNAGNVLVGDNP